MSKEKETKITNIVESQAGGERTAQRSWALTAAQNKKENRGTVTSPTSLDSQCLSAVQPGLEVTVLSM